MSGIILHHSIRAFNTPGFKQALKLEAESLAHHQLPLQKGLTHSSVVSDSPFQVMILSDREQADEILVKAGIFYTGVITGCQCSDDPEPMDEQNEYCEVMLQINKTSGLTIISLVDDK